MSWDVYLSDDEHGVVQVPHHSEGGIHAFGGTDNAELNITYNYGRVYNDLLGGNIKEVLHGKIAADTTDLLQSVVDQLGTNQSSDYWDPTPGNAGHALSILLSWAKLHPRATWSVY